MATVAGLKIKCIKRLDSLLGIPLAYLIPPPVSQQKIEIKSILIIRPGGIGDALLLAPAIKSLKIHYADASITILAERRNAGAFALVPSVDKLLLYDRCSDLRALFSAQFDLVIDTEQWHRLSAVVASLLPSAFKIGFQTNERSRLFTHTAPYSHEEYEAQSFLDLLKPLGFTENYDCSAPFLSLSAAARQEAECHFRGDDSPYIAVFPGASVKERRWGTGKFRELVERLSAAGIKSVIIGAKEDQPAGDMIVAGVHGLNLTGKTSIAGTAAIIGGSRLLVSGDSGVLHIGAGLGIPTVSLFGAGIAQKWAPPGDNHIVLNLKLACSPCTLFGTTPACPNKVRCLEEIKVETVIDAVFTLFER